LGAEVEFEVAHEPVELAVADRALLLLAEVVADDALDLVEVLEQAVDAAVLLDPLDGRLLADLVDPRQVVARLPDERGDLGILLGLDAVPLDDRVTVVALELRDPARVRVEQRDAIVDQLDGVAVAGGDE